MDVWLFIWHALNFFVPAAGLALLMSAALALSGRTLTGFGRCALALFVVGAVVSLAGLLFQGRDGRMFTYAIMVLAVGSLAAWWRVSRL